MKTLDQIIAELPADRRAKIAGRARQLIGEEMALRQLRKARKLTQEQVARTLKIGQDGVSRLESRSDFFISTLQSYVKAMGGELRIVAEFKDGVVSISGLGIEEDAIPAKPPTPKKAGRQKRHLALAQVR